MTGRLAAAALVLLLAGCSRGTTNEPPAPVPSAGATRQDGDPTGDGMGAGTDPPYSKWKLGAHPLPVGPDGFGIADGTPKPLRHRLFPTKDLLPPPASGRFESSIGPITPAIRKRMGKSWSPACPVGLDDLRYLNVSFRGFDGKAHTGEIVVAASEAKDVVSVFRALFRAGFPIEEMRLPTTADIDAPPTGDGNDTAGLVCRAARGQTSWSVHAYGLAIDVNPFLNPYSKGDVVLPELASSYLDRTNRQPGVIHAGDLIVREFARIGWSWGGSWTSLKDYQHFTATGR